NISPWISSRTHTKVKVKARPGARAIQQEPDTELRSELPSLFQLQPEQLDCGAAHLQHPLSILQPLKSSPVFRAPGLTSVAVASANNYTVVFLGTVNGRLLKVNLNESMQVVSRRVVTVAYGEPVHPVMQFDPADPGYLYLMTSHQMARVKVAACDVHVTCAACLGAADAYCGWCALETRCTLQQDCANATQPHFWTSTSEGPGRCPAMTVLPAEIDVRREYPGMILQISGSLPSLSGMQMACDYGKDIRTVARVPGPAYGHQIAYCNLLPRRQFPPFPAHQDHVTLEMALRVNGRNIVSANFTIYDCSRMAQVYPQAACTRCLSAPWPCFWCTQQHTCVSNQSRCEASPNPTDPQDCPQILPLSLVPVPTGGSQDILVPLANAASFHGAALECSLGPEDTFEATWLNASVVRCNQVAVSGVASPRGPGRPSSPPCPLLGSHPPSPSALPPSLPLVHNLDPKMGPKAGGTRITIHGSDLHVGSELQVLVNDTDPCTELVRTETSITCTVPGGAQAAPVPVCVRLERRGCVRGNLTFWYMPNPVITAISPRRSPVSGGRTITVAGERFHMVQNVSMSVHHIGREPTLCKVLNATLITCPSPGALSNASAPVDFFINGRAYADEVAVAEELGDPEEVPRGSRFRLDYLPNPQFSTAKREKWIKHHPGEPLTLVIHKEQDSLGLESHEYRVKIGQVACDIQIISERVIHCSVNESLGAAEGQLPITVSGRGGADSGPPILGTAASWRGPAKSHPLGLPSSHHLVGSRPPLPLRSLPLRFWVNILKNPQFVFDIEKTDHIDACLSVIAQAFIDACSISDLQLGKDSPTNKLLYAKEIPEYRKVVQRYYKQIQDMTPLSEQEMNAHLAEESRKYQNEFNTNVAMTEIYKYAKRYRPQIMAALEANPTARRTQLQHKFEQVVALMENNIYECYSEA
ncbi:plexin-D1, partial [Marmota marmota marmota]|uniref:plexin-D1 n=1 Tax=Marmota marmota marmota TaxID=9994 RepID=UPI00209308FD